MLMLCRLLQYQKIPTNCYRSAGSNTMFTIIIIVGPHHTCNNAFPTSESKSPFQICGILYLRLHRVRVMFYNHFKYRISKGAFSTILQPFHFHSINNILECDATFFHQVYIDCPSIFSRTKCNTCILN